MMRWSEGSAARNKPLVPSPRNGIWSNADDRALLDIFSVAPRTEASRGWKKTFTLVDAPRARDFGSRRASRMKRGASGPVMETDLRASGARPELVMIRYCARVVSPAGWLNRSREALVAMYGTAARY